MILITRFLLSNILGVFNSLRVLGNTMPAFLAKLLEKSNLSLDRCVNETPSVNKLFRGERA